MLFQTRADRFAPFALCRASEPAWAFPTGDHTPVMPALRLPVLRCCTTTTAAHDRVHHRDPRDQRPLSRRWLLQVPGRWRPDVVPFCSEWREYNRTGPPASHLAARGAAQNCEWLRDGNSE